MIDNTDGVRFHSQDYSASSNLCYEECCNEMRVKLTRKLILESERISLTIRLKSPEFRK